VKTALEKNKAETEKGLHGQRWWPPLCPMFRQALDLLGLHPPVTWNKHRFFLILPSYINFGRIDQVPSVMQRHKSRSCEQHEMPARCQALEWSPLLPTLNPATSPAMRMGRRPPQTRDGLLQLLKSSFHPAIASLCCAWAMGSESCRCNESNSHPTK
jgi:hypothetical protein